MTVHQFSATLMNGNEKSLADYKGKVLLIVNTATKCGLASQLQDLQALYDTYKAKGLIVLGFPCNQFKKQEPGTNEDTAKICQFNFSVDFPLFQKLDVNGDEAHPLYKYLKKQKPGIGSSAIKWNFTKFLINREGKVMKRYAPITALKKVEADLIELLD